MKGLVVLGQPEARKERADAQQNRARILDAARKLMKKRALDQLCMDELAALAGVGKGTLYRRFEDKQALLLALLDDDERILQEDIRASYKKGAPREALLGLLDKLYAFHLEHAPVLAAAEASARGMARFESPPYQWRHSIIAEHLVWANVVDNGAAADHLADCLLATMSGELLTRALLTSQAEEVAAQARAFFHAVCR
jgi:AcrR family transcriptional regulator